MSSSKQSVLAAIVGNTVVMTGKFVVSGLTGSSTMLSEAFHSLADVLNQILLLKGIKQSEKDANAEYKSGYGRARFVWALISATGIFFLGCGMSLWHGIQGLLSHEPHAVKDLHIAIAVIVVSLIIEGAVLLYATKALMAQAKTEDLPLYDYLSDHADPTELAVLLEDGAACIGLIIALICIWLTDMTGNPHWDSIGSILVGVLLGAVAIVLIQKNKALLTGRSIPDSDMNRLKQILKSKKMIQHINHIRAEVIGANQYEIQVELQLHTETLLETMNIDFTEAYSKIKSQQEFEVYCRSLSIQTVEHIVSTIDSFETEIISQIPEVKYIDIEPN
ncbi:MAG: cation diffusion facilitator family transporter [Myxococcota bacterium]